MKQQYVQVETRDDALVACPWVAEVVEVEGGYICFESVDDAKVFKNQC